MRSLTAALYKLLLLPPWPSLNSRSMNLSISVLVMLCVVLPCIESLTLLWHSEYCYRICCGHYPKIIPFRVHNDQALPALARSASVVSSWWSSHCSITSAFLSSRFLRWTLLDFFFPICLFLNNNLLTWFFFCTSSFGLLYPLSSKVTRVMQNERILVLRVKDFWLPYSSKNCFVFFFFWTNSTSFNNLRPFFFLPFYVCFFKNLHTTSHFLISSPMILYHTYFLH